MKRFSILAWIVIFSVSGWSRALPAAEQTGRLKNELLQVYLASARLHDLLGLLQPATWKMPEAERSSFTDELDSAQSELQTLEKWRYQFLYHQQNPEYGKNLLAALRDLIPEIEEISDTAARYESPAAGAQFKRPAQQLANLNHDIITYMASAFPGQIPKAAGAATAAAAPPASKRVTTQPPPAAVTSAAQKPPSAASSAENPAAPLRQASQAAPAPPAAPAISLQPDQLRALLGKVFLSEARVKDLLSLLQPQNWRMNTADRAVVNDRLQSFQGQLGTVEKWRYELYYHPQDLKVAEQTATALGQAVPEVEGIASLASQYEGDSAGEPFAAPAKELADAHSSLEAYAASLSAQVEKELYASPAGLPKGKGLETERITAPGAVPPPLTSMIVAPPPLTHAQVKQILYNIYVSAYRIRDLLSQERPANWNAPAANRTLMTMSRQTLLSKLGQVEKWRALFSQNPNNMYDAFQTFLSIAELLHPLRDFSRAVSQYERTDYGQDYLRRANEMEAHLNAIAPYVGFILKNESNSMQMYQADLVSCQNKLSYAMHGYIHAATPIRNEVPAFQGRRVRKRQAKKKADAK